MPSSRQARMTRTAISPRLAMRILVSIGCVCWCRDRGARHPRPLTWQVTLGRRDRFDQRRPARGGPRRGALRAPCWSPTTRPRAGVGSAAGGRRRPARRCWSSILLPPDARPAAPPAAAHPGRRPRPPPPPARRWPGCAPELKWPNDLLVGDRKLAGVLAESVVDGGQVVGRRRRHRAQRGLAATSCPPSWPASLTALNHECGHDVDRLAAARRPPRPPRPATDWTELSTRPTAPAWPRSGARCGSISGDGRARGQGGRRHAPPVSWWSRMPTAATARSTSATSPTCASDALIAPPQGRAA